MITFITLKPFTSKTNLSLFPTITMTIHRKFEPDPAALDQLVEVLYELLLDGPSEDRQTESPQPKIAATRSCFSCRPE